MTVFVSAGHGPVDRGVVWLGFGEHAEACAWRNAIVTFGNLLGVPFEGVPVVSLREKVEHINRGCLQDGPSIAVEIHFNAGGEPAVTRGCETLYAPKSSRGAVLAELVQEKLDPLFPSSSGRSRGIKEAWYRQDHPHRVDYAGDVDGDEMPDYFCRATSCPAIICEPEFIYDRSGIQGKREAACRAIATALAQGHRLLCPQL